MRLIVCASGSKAGGLPGTCLISREKDRKGGIADHGQHQRRGLSRAREEKIDKCSSSSKKKVETARLERFETCTWKRAKLITRRGEHQGAPVPEERAFRCQENSLPARGRRRITNGEKRMTIIKGQNYRSIHTVLRKKYREGVIRKESSSTLSGGEKIGSNIRAEASREIVLLRRREQERDTPL